MEREKKGGNKERNMKWKKNTFLRGWIQYVK